MVCKIIFSENGLPSKVISDAGTNFISEKLTASLRGLTYNMQYNHYAATRAVDKQKHALNSLREKSKKCYETNADIYVFTTGNINTSKSQTT